MSGRVSIKFNLQKQVAAYGPHIDGPLLESWTTDFQTTACVRISWELIKIWDCTPRVSDSAELENLHFWQLSTWYWVHECHFRNQWLSLVFPDALYCVGVCGGAVACIVGCLTASLAFPHEMPATSEPRLWSDDQHRCPMWAKALVLPPAQNQNIQMYPLCLGIGSSLLVMFWGGVSLFSEERRERSDRWIGNPQHLLLIPSSLLRRKTSLAKVFQKIRIPIS